MRDNNSKFFILFYFILLSGCKAVSPPSFEEQSITYNRTMEQYKINQIFTNIIRAAEDRPLAFIDIPSVLGNANISTRKRQFINNNWWNTWIFFRGNFMG